MRVVVTPLDKGDEPHFEERGGRSIEGMTRDLGMTGLTLLLGRVRVGGRYVTDTDCHLGLRLELPAGEVFLLARVVRFEQPPEDDPGQAYLLGLRILKLREGDEPAYLDFLKTLLPAERRRSDRERARAELSAPLRFGGETAAETEGLTAAEVSAAFERFIGASTRSTQGRGA
jgi:hypothetical protein